MFSSFSKSFSCGRRCPVVSDYVITTSTDMIQEGQQLTVTLTTVDVANGTNIPYTITGVASEDIDGASLTGNFFVMSNSASFIINISEDFVAEGETFTISLDAHPVSKSVTITDLWAPSQLANLLGWYDASDGSTIGGSDGAVTGWTDKAGSNDLSLGAPSNTKPTRSNNVAPNDKKVLYFAGDQYMYGGLGTQSSLDNGNHFAVAVCRPSNVNNQKDSIWSYDGGNSNDRDYAISANHTSKFHGEVDLGNDAAPVGILGPWGSTNYETDFHIFVAVFDSTQGTIYMRVDGEQVDSTTYSNDLEEDLHLRLMVNRNGNRKLQGYLAEFCSVKGLPGTGGADISYVELLEGYLAHKWGMFDQLPVSHPYKTEAP